MSHTHTYRKNLAESALCMLRLTCEAQNEQRIGKRKY